MSSADLSDDAALAELIVTKLSQPLDLETDDVSVVVSSGHVALSGTVPLRRMLRPIEMLVKSCEGVVSVDNQIMVDAPDVNAEIGGYPAPDEGVDIAGPAGERQVNHEV